MDAAFWSLATAWSSEFCRAFRDEDAEERWEFAEDREEEAVERSDLASAP